MAGFEKCPFRIKASRFKTTFRGRVTCFLWYFKNKLSAETQSVDLIHTPFCQKIIQKFQLDARATWFLWSHKEKYCFQKKKIQKNKAKNCVNYATILHLSLVEGIVGGGCVCVFFLLCHYLNRICLPKVCGFCCSGLKYYP